MAQDLMISARLAGEAGDAVRRVEDQHASATAVAAVLVAAATRLDDAAATLRGDNGAYYRVAAGAAFGMAVALAGWRSGLPQMPISVAAVGVGGCAALAALYLTRRANPAADIGGSQPAALTRLDGAAHPPDALYARLYGAAGDTATAARFVAAVVAALPDPGLPAPSGRRGRRHHTAARSCRDALAFLHRAEQLLQALPTAAPLAPPDTPGGAAALAGWT